MAIRGLFSCLEVQLSKKLQTRTQCSGLSVCMQLIKLKLYLKNALMSNCILGVFIFAQTLFFCNFFSRVLQNRSFLMLNLFQRWKRKRKSIIHQKIYFIVYCQFSFESAGQQYSFPRNYIFIFQPFYLFFHFFLWRRVR